MEYFIGFYAVFFVIFLFARINLYPVSLVTILGIEGVLTGIRSIVYLINGNYNQHFDAVDQQTYAIAQFFETSLFFALIFIFRKFPDPLEKYLSCTLKDDKTPIIAYIIFELIIILMCFLIAGTTWIHGNRDTTMSVSSPAIRYVFPSLLFSATIVSIYSIKYCFLNAGILKLLPVVLLLSSIVVFMMIGQRGLFIIIAAASILGLYKTNVINNKNLVLVFLSLFFYGVFSRSIVDGSISSESLVNTLDVFIKGGDGTKLDSIAFAISNINNFDVESLSVLNEVLTFLPHQLRIDNGTMTVSDYLNTIAVGRYYYDFGNGYNFGNLASFFVLYGYLGILLSIILALIYKNLFRNQLCVVMSADKVFVYFLCLMFFIESIGTIHWIVYAVLMLYIVNISSIIFKTCCER